MKIHIIIINITIMSRTYGRHLYDSFRRSSNFVLFPRFIYILFYFLFIYKTHLSNVVNAFASSVKQLLFFLTILSHGTVGDKDIITSETLTTCNFVMLIKEGVCKNFSRGGAWSFLNFNITDFLKIVCRYQENILKFTRAHYCHTYK